MPFVVSEADVMAKALSLWGPTFQLPPDMEWQDLREMINDPDAIDDMLNEKELSGMDGTSP